MKKRKVACMECGKQFQTYRKNHKFCSVNCRVLSWQHKKLDPSQLELFAENKNDTE
jgi:hypothetical protein